MGTEFEWDPEKPARNAAKHGVGMAEGASVFGDPLAQIEADPVHSLEEDRYRLIGHSETGHQAYRLRPEVDALHRVGVITGQPISESSMDEIGQRMVDPPDPKANFQDGLVVGDDKTVVIERLAFAGERVFCRVAAPTPAGELVITEVVPMLWWLAGIERTFDQLKQFLQVMQYGTATPG